MIPDDVQTLAPDVTDEDYTRALEGDPAPFIDLDDDVQDTNDEVAARSFVVVPATIRQRCENAKRLRDDRVELGVGMCLAAVRGPILNLPAVYPTAAVAADHSMPFHPRTGADTFAVPRGAIGFAWNGRAGHVWLELGAALVSTTDFHESGLEGVALRSRMLEWCGATRWGWGESVNGFDVWPTRKRHKPKPPPEWDLADRADFLKVEIRRALEAGHTARAGHLKVWRQHILSNLEHHHAVTGK